MRCQHDVDPKLGESGQLTYSWVRWAVKADRKWFAAKPNGGLMRYVDQGLAVHLAIGAAVYALVPTIAQRGG